MVSDWLTIALMAALQSAQVCARSSKFSLFDPAKEMAYIQMSRKEKSKGKAAVDLIGSQVQNSWTPESSLRECASKRFCDRTAYGTPSHCIGTGSSHTELQLLGED